MQTHNSTFDTILITIIWVLQAIIAYVKHFVDFDFNEAFDIAFKLVQFAALCLSAMASYRIYKKNK